MRHAARSVGIRELEAFNANRVGGWFLSDQFSSANTITRPPHGPENSDGFVKWGVQSVRSVLGGERERETYEVGRF